MSAPRTPAPDDDYLGDGVYASHDGYQIWIAVNHHANRVAALDHSTLTNLIDYAKRIGMIT